MATDTKKPQPGAAPAAAPKAAPTVAQKASQIIRKADGVNVIISRLIGLVRSAERIGDVAAASAKPLVEAAEQQLAEIKTDLETLRK